jgi:hypothetical protein
MKIEIANVAPARNTALANFADENETNRPSSNATTPSVATQGTLMISGMPQTSEQPFKVIPFVKPSGPLPNWMVDGGTLAQEQNEAREQIRKLMRNKVRPDFHNTPLRVVLESFATSADLPILVDTDVLEGSGLNIDDPVSLQGLGEVSLQRALQLVLDPKELCYIVEPEHIQITTKDNGVAGILRTYDLAFLLPNNQRLEEIIFLIQSTTPARWDVDGGEDSLQHFGSMLIARCPEEVHLKIEGLLFEISKMNKDNLK